MRLYKLSQDVNNDYDTYDACVVVAKDAAQARRFHPGGFEDWETEEGFQSSWANNCTQVKVTYIGEAHTGMDAGVVLASYNAG